LPPSAARRGTSNGSPAPTAVDRAETWRSFKETKYAFHRLIAEIAGNAFILEVFDRIVASRRKAWDGFRPRPQDLASARAASLEENQAILDAIADGHGPRAAEAVRSSVERLLASIAGS
jgi:GntR family transcriptional regulator, transcriptional repressor for pyruvate dehydrogenase complex